ncbi:hypothetical protein F4775DRAFT_587423 [Biscogniauxia sp. FL1348]|nr:hypothetical protein F4775DRAFT_587423 [Biscogniauxia sp. FL1348]
MKQVDDVLKKLVAQHFKGAGWKTDEVIRGMMGTKDFYPSDSYATGTAGAGTTLAMTGAYVLAGEMARHKGGDLAAGLRGYEETMRPIVDGLQKFPALVPTIFAPQTAWGL